MSKTKEKSLFEIIIEQYVAKGWDRMSAESCAREVLNSKTY